MARPPAFDRDAALEAAMKLFWTQGYQGTSLPELLTTMGIARSSFYASFGDKDSLYRECLSLFGDRTLGMLLHNCDPADPRACVRQFFECTLLQVPAHRVQRGCMMVNTLLETAEVEPDLQALARDKLQAVRNSFEDLFHRSAATGSLPGERSPAELADLVMTINLGLRVQSRQQPDVTQLHAIVATSLSLLDRAA